MNSIKTLTNYEKIFDISHVNSFGEFLEKIHCYGNNIAFRTRKDYLSYNDFYDAIQKVSSYFCSQKNTFFLIKIDSPFYFAVAYFSIIMSDNIAILSQEKDIEYIGITEYTVIDESKLINYFSTTTVQYPCSKANTEFCTLVCSSGTTNVKKGVMLSQKNILSDTFGGMEYYEYKKGSVYLNILPYSHLFGVVADLLGPLYSGGIICYCINKYNFFEDLKYYAPNVLNLPPALVYLIHQKLLDTSDFIASTGGNLKKIMCAGAKLDENVNSLFQKYNLTVYTAYGLTECSPCVSMSGEYGSKLGSVGRILKSCSVKISDGEILVSGENVMLGYWGETSNYLTIEDGWLHTGDLGHIDDDGFLYIDGRKSNIIVFEDGFKINPEDLENRINKLNKVIESYVYAHKTDRTRINIRIVSYTHQTDELMFEIKKLLIKYKYIGYLANIYFTDELLERNELGKIKRNK